MRGTIVKRAAGSWTIKASGGFDDAGRRIRPERTVRGSRRDAERALTALQREVDQGTVARSAELFDRYLLERWLPHVRTRVAPETFDRYESLARTWIAPRVHVKLERLRPHHIQRVLDEMVAAGAASASVVKAYHVMGAACRQAVRWQLLAVDPTTGARPPRAGRPELRIPDAREMRALVEAARATPYGLPIELAASTGARRGELLRLRWRDVDLEQATAVITAGRPPRRAGRSTCRPRRCGRCALTAASRPSAACCSVRRGRTSTSSWTVATAARYTRTRSRTRSPRSPTASGSGTSGCTTYGTGSRASSCAPPSRSRSSPRRWGTRGAASPRTCTSTSCPGWASRSRPRSNARSRIHGELCHQFCHQSDPDGTGRAGTDRDAEHRLTSANTTRQDDAVGTRTRLDALSRRRSRDRSPSGALIRGVYREVPPLCCGQACGKRHYPEKLKPIPRADQRPLGSHRIRSASRTSRPYSHSASRWLPDSSF
jgi:integrase